MTAATDGENNNKIIPPQLDASQLGALSERFESGGRGPGTINPYTRQGFGDHGGASYGTYQIANGPGTLARFLKWMDDRYPEIAVRFAGLSPATPEFDSAWINTALIMTEEFGRIQHEFIRITHYDLLVRKLEDSAIYLQLETRATVLRDVIWSTAVQHGPTGGCNVIRNAINGKVVEAMSDYELIMAIYSERGANDGRKYFSRNSDQVIESVVNRFKKEFSLAVERLEVVVY